MNLTDDVRVGVLELFQHVRRGHGNGPPVINMGIGESEVTIDGNGPFLIYRLADDLALGSNGTLSHDGAEDLLKATCWAYINDGSDRAIEGLVEKIQQPPGTWKIVRPCRLYLGSDVVDVGRCRIQRGLPPGPEYLDHWFDAFLGYSISTDVQAHDFDAARTLAGQTFAEALAVLQLSHWESVPVLERPVIAWRPDGTAVYNGDPTTYLQADRGIHRDGTLGPLQEALSSVALKSEADRTDWERRTLAAARWLSKGMATDWPSDVVTSLIVCLETIFTEGKKQKRKAEPVADAVAKYLPAVQPMTTREQRKWLLKIFHRRTDAAHEGRNIPTDVDLSRLAFIGWVAVTWAANHLVADHSRRGRACETFEEAHADHSVLNVARPRPAVSEATTPS